MAIKPKAGILEIAPYVGGEVGLKGLSNICKLSANEGALGPSPMVIKAIAEAAQNIHRYPDSHAEDLREAIGYKHQINPEQILCGNGSDEIITFLVQAFAGAGDEVIYSRHGFLMYPITALAMGAQPIWAEEADYTTDIEALLARVSSRTKMVFIANPNNPTGTYISDDQMRKFRKKLPDDVLLVIDAAYAEFTDAVDYDCGIQLVNEFDNVVMTRTFSKAYALGGARLGWCYASKAIIDILNRIRGPFNVNSLALAAGCAAIHDEDHLQNTVTHTLYWRRWLEQEISRCDIRVLPSQGNFVLALFKNVDEANRAEEKLREQGVIVRKMGAYHLAQALRISVGREDENQSVVAILKKLKGK